MESNSDPFTIVRVYIPSIEQSNAINAAADKEITREVMAEFFADCLCAGPTVDFKLVNFAIMSRWPKGLDFIKTLGWNLYEARIAASKLAPNAEVASSPDGVTKGGDA